MTGNVVSRDESGYEIVLEESRENACEACSKSASCSLPGMRSIHVDFGDSESKLEVNDRVEVEMSARKLVGLSALVYLMPLVLMLAGGIPAGYYSELAGILGSLSGLALGLLINIIVNRRLKMSKMISIRRIV